MSLNISDVLYAAKLACIEITEEEAQQTLLSINNTMTIVEAMKSFDVSSVEPMTHAQAISLRLREDVVTETDQRDYYQTLAPLVENGLFLVPTVIE